MVAPPHCMIKAQVVHGKGKVRLSGFSPASPENNFVASVKRCSIPASSVVNCFSIR